MTSTTSSLVLLIALVALTVGRPHSKHDVDDDESDTFDDFYYYQKARLLSDHQFADEERPRTKLPFLEVGDQTAFEVQAIDVANYAMFVEKGSGAMQNALQLQDGKPTYLDIKFTARETIEIRISDVVKLELRLMQGGEESAPIVFDVDEFSDICPKDSTSAYFTCKNDSKSRTIHGFRVPSWREFKVSPLADLTTIGIRMLVNETSLFHVAAFVHIVME